MDSFFRRAKANSANIIKTFFIKDGFELNGSWLTVIKRSSSYYSFLNSIRASWVGNVITSFDLSGC